MNSFDEVFALVKRYCLEKGNIPEVAVKLWIDALTPVHLDGTTALFTVQSEFQRDVILNNYESLLKEAFLSTLGFEIHLEIQVEESGAQPSLDPQKSQNYDEIVRRHEELEHSFEGANYEYTFSTFVHGNCNEIAFQAAYAVAKTADHPDQADQKMNPLFIYGPSGLGKTHLLHAICNYIHENKPELSVLFVSSETFTNELIDAIQNHTMPKFRAKYRNLDFLLIDDVQFFGSKDATKMEIFNTFNDLFDKKKHIIMTSDRTPQDIDKLEDRLQTRFSSGLVAPISPPDYEICCIILQQRAEKLNITLPKDVVDYIASHINTNVRELEGAFNKLVTFSQIKKQTITLAFTKDALKDQIPLDNRQELTVDFIIDTVCQYYGVKKDKLLGRGRPQKIVIPRQIAMYLCRNELNESYPTLRDYFHRKDHSTVLYACERVEKDIERDPQTCASIEAIRKLLKQRG